MSHVLVRRGKERHGPEYFRAVNRENSSTLRSVLLFSHSRFLDEL